VGKNKKGRLRGGVRIGRMREWIGGLVEFPESLGAEASAMRALMWLIPDGRIAGIDMVESARVAEEAAASLQKAISSPQCGLTMAPSRVRVASEELAEALRSGDVDAEILIGPTPEFDKAAASFMDHLVQDQEPAPWSTLDAGAEPDSVGALFRTLMELYLLEPWKRLPPDTGHFQFGMRAFGWPEAVVSFFGLEKSAVGFTVLPSPSAYDAFLAGAKRGRDGLMEGVPDHLCVLFENVASLPSAVRREVMKYGWDVLGPEAVPIIIHRSADGSVRGPLQTEVVMLEAAVEGVLSSFEEPEVLRVWDEGDLVQGEIEVATSRTGVTFSMTCPADPNSVYAEPMDSILEWLQSQPYEIGEDDEEGGQLERIVLDRFSRSKEAAKLKAPVGHAELAGDLARSCLGKRFISLDPTEFLELVFEIFPSHGNVVATDAGDIVRELRAFVRYLKRVGDFARADQFIEVLAGNAIRKLEGRLGDSNRFGMAKTLIMAGLDSGYDIHSREGLEAWMSKLQEGPIPDHIKLPHERPASPPRNRPKKKR